MSGSEVSTDSSERYEVVIRSEGGLEKEHAELIKKKLIREGRHEHVVHVEEVVPDPDQQEHDTEADQRPEIEFDHQTGTIRVGGIALKLRMADASNDREYVESFKYEFLDDGVEGWSHPDYDDVVLELWAVGAAQQEVEG